MTGSGMDWAASEGLGLAAVAAGSDTGWVASKGSGSAVVVVAGCGTDWAVSVAFESGMMEEAGTFVSRP